MEPVNQNSSGATERGRVDMGLGPNNPTIGKDRRVDLPHAISGIDVDSPNGKAHKRKKQNQAPVPPVSGATRWIVLIGAVFALICAEAWSSPTLFSLAEQAKAPKQLAWLLPAVLDGYAATSIWFGNSVPKTHPAHGEAIANTRLALLITVACNSVFHLLALAKGSLPPWVPIALLVTVTALPIYITDRLVRMYKLADGSGKPAVATPATPAPATAPARPATTPNPVATPATATAPAQPATPRAATKQVAPKAAPTSNGGSVTTLVPRPERLRIVRELIAERGGDAESVPLAEIRSMFGGDKSTASRLRSDAANGEGGTAPLADVPVEGVS